MGVDAIQLRTQDVVSQFIQSNRIRSLCFKSMIIWVIKYFSFKILMLGYSSFILGCK